MLNSINNLLENALDTVLPPRCAISGNVVVRQGDLDPNAWGKIDFLSPPFCEICGDIFSANAFKAKTKVSGLCLRCSSCKPSFKCARSAILYDSSGRDIILGFKHGDKVHCASTFVPWLMRAGAKLISRADFLIPVPLHPKRLVMRRYNQAALLTDGISRKSGIKALMNALTRTRFTDLQGHKTIDQRQRNVNGAFEFISGYLSAIKGRSILLIDDVITTGATANACADVLLSCGAGNVDVLTIARVDRALHRYDNL